jgi:hypothetical protein
MASNTQNTSPCLSCDDFDALVMDYVYVDGLSETDQTQLQNHESSCKKCAELAVSLRETHEMALLMTNIEPRAMLDAKILDLAHHPRNAYRFPRMIEPVGWLAAASLLLSCGYIVGLLTTSPAVNKQEKMVASRTGHNSGSLTGDVAVGTIYLNNKDKNRSTEITWKSNDYHWVGLKNLQCYLAGAEKSLVEFDRNGEHRDILIAYYQLQKSRGLVKQKSSRDGPLAIDSHYRKRVERLEKRIKELAREKKLQLSPGG